MKDIWGNFKILHSLKIIIWICFGIKIAAKNEDKVIYPKELQGEAVTAFVAVPVRFQRKTSQPI